MRYVLRWFISYRVSPQLGNNYRVNFWGGDMEKIDILQKLGYVDNFMWDIDCLYYFVLKNG